MTDEPKDVRLPLMVTKSEAEAIDEWRYSNRVPTRAEAIRMLIHRGLSLETYADAINEIMSVVMPILARGNATDAEIHRIALAANTQSHERMDTLVFEQKIKDQMHKAKFSDPKSGILSVRKRATDLSD